MRLSVTLFLLSFTGALFGGWLIGRWCVGVVIVGYSLALAVIALLRDDGKHLATPVIDTGSEEDRFRRQVTADYMSRVA